MLKGIGAMLVIIGHATRIFSTQSAFGYDVNSKVIDGLCSIIYLFHMPLFFSISGGLFYRGIRSGKYAHISSFVLSKAKRLMVPFAFTGAFIVYPTLIYCGLEESNLGQYIVDGLILGNNARHLWYLPTVFELLLISCIMFKAVGNRLNKMHIVFYLLLFVGGRVFSPSPYYLRQASYNSIFFLEGILLDGESCIIGFAKKNRIIILPFCFLIVATGSISDFILLRELICGLCGVVGTYLLANHLLKSPLSYRMFCYFSDHGMSLYLFHPMIIYLIAFLFRGRLNDYVLICIMFISAILLSLMIERLLQKTRLLILIGED